MYVCKGPPSSFLPCFLYTCVCGYVWLSVPCLLLVMQRSQLPCLVVQTSIIIIIIILLHAPPSLGRCPRMCTEWLCVWYKGG
jgi:hypothetical protein